ncbi:MAG: hypothetical protein WCD76_08060 [Pyrinomonadaceae bacterium]
MNEEIAKWIIASGGWLVAIFTLMLGYLERKQTREEERLGRTLDYFDGGSQRRSIGIALIEGLWMNKARHHDVIVPLIANQIVYLLLSSKSSDAHEERNLVRLVMIFKSIPNLRAKYHDRWADVCDAIGRKLEGEQNGMPVSPQTLNMWSKALQSSDAA